MYRLLFIDELKDEFNEFKDYIEEKTSQEKIEIVTLLPLETLDEMIEEIVSIKPDAIISDFMLNEYKEDIQYNIPYDGVELVQGFLKIREGFPCFVLTSFDDNAIKKCEDVNIVYIKGILHGSEEKANSKANFLERIENQILHYRKKMEETETRLLELIKKGEITSLDVYEMQELIELDTLVEKNLDKESQIPLKLKEEFDSDKLKNLIEKVDLLNKKLNNGE
ncbi:MAG TPA: hypothetical protein DEP28_06125 [Bacteroidetes bacterium]|nr:hypothetical protein [Bacteroidota bacterium]HCN37556.1 hypothetical protein [Bacteroidota bacterium]